MGHGSVWCAPTIHIGNFGNFVMHCTRGVRHIVFLSCGETCMRLDESYNNLRDLATCRVVVVADCCKDGYSCAKTNAVDIGNLAIWLLRMLS